MKNNKKITTKLLIATMLFLSANLNSATHTVTNGNDAGAGSLRQAVFDANSGDTIIFASNVSTVSLTSGQITIDKSLAINGGSDTNQKITIDGNNNSRIFYVDMGCELSISNLILTGAYCNILGGVSGGAVGVDAYGAFIANNCEFSNNTAWFGGAVDVFFGAIFTAINCIFSNNGALEGGAVRVYTGGDFTANNCVFINNVATNNGGAVFLLGCISFTATNCIFTNNTATTEGGAVGGGLGAIFIANNCIFTNNNTTTWMGGAVSIHHGSIFIAINSTFFNNTAESYVIYADNGMYLYHCTIDKNKTKSGEMIHGSFGGLYEYAYGYNNIITGNTVADTLNQIKGTLLGGVNLIEGENGVIRYSVFGNNTLTDSGYIMPLEYAKTAPRLTAFDIEVPWWIISADSIITWLYKDQREKVRPDSGFVTFGAVEYDESSIKELIRLLLTVNIFPNPTSNYFTVNFELEKASNMEIILFDVLGKEIENVYNDFAEVGFFTKTINTEHLNKGVYFIKILIDGKYATLEKIVVN